MAIDDAAASIIEQLCCELLELCELARPHVDPNEIAEAERTVDTAHRMIYDD